LLDVGSRVGINLKDRGSGIPEDFPDELYSLELMRISLYQPSEQPNVPGITGESDQLALANERLGDAAMQNDPALYAASCKSARDILESLRDDPACSLLWGSLRIGPECRGG
jgi:hypothetical protein